jgi:hypothetical protein
MHVVVHFGTFKTGTTSIQETFARSRAAFLAEGVFYPDAPVAPAHHVLFALFHEAVPARIPLQLGLDLPGMRDLGRAAWARIRREIALRNPDKVVLSSELFLMEPTLAGFRRFRTLLEELGAPLTLCCYVRAPAPYYLSYVQQNAKMSGDVSPPRPLAIRAGVERVEEAFGQPMVVRAFDPAQLAGGDVVRDFHAEVVGCPPPNGVALDRRFNETLSAEAMAISVANRRTNCPGQDHRPIRAHRRLLDLLAEIERTTGGIAKPRLRPEVADAVTCASTDLLWLRDARGITFPGIDYAPVDGRFPDDIATRRDIDRICDVDPARREFLTMRLLQAGLDAHIELSRLERILPVGRLLSLKEMLGRRQRSG